MKIISIKTDFYINEEFYRDVITQKYVDGVALNVAYNRDKELFVYDTRVIASFDLQKIQTIPYIELENAELLTLEESLNLIMSNRNDIPVYLNLLPINFNVVDDATLEQLNILNNNYIMLLKDILKRYPTLTFLVHSVSQRLILNLRREMPNIPKGVVITASDLTPIDVNYYVFSTTMIDDEIFLQLINRNKEIYIYVNNDSDLSVIIQLYDSEKSTALSQKVFPKLNFMVNQPSIITRVFPKKN